MNILEETKQFLSGEALISISQSLGESEAATKKALSALLPTVLTKILTDASNDPNASKLFEMLRVAAQQGIIPSSPEEFTRSDSLIKIFSGIGASHLVETVLGNKIHSTIEAVSALSGVKRSSVTGLLSLCVPTTLSVIKRYIVSQPDPKLALIDLSATQLIPLKNVVPSQLIEAVNVSPMVSAPTVTTIVRPSGRPQTAGNSFYWIAPVALVIALLGGLWYYYQTGSRIALQQEAASNRLANNIQSEVEEKFAEAKKQTNDVAASIADNTAKVLASTNMQALLANSDRKQDSAFKDSALKDSTLKGANQLNAAALNDLQNGALQAAQKVPNEPQLADKTGASTAVSQPLQVAANNELAGGAPLARASAAIPATDSGQPTHVTLPSGQELLVDRGSFIDELVQAFKTRSKDSPAKFTFDNVSFESSSPKITKSSTQQLDALVKVLQAYPAASIKITGFTDASGDAARNKNLSFGRSKAVRQYLTKNGIDENRISVYGEGADSPVATNDTPEGRALNRRIEVSILKK